MKKGVGALEIIFGMFILIIVVLVLIRMFTSIVKPDKINQQLEGFESSYKMASERAACGNMCDIYRDSGCSRRDAVAFCLQKVNIDIDGNKIPGEKYHGNFVNNLPYCEDGLYCFHIMKECNCGNYKLSKENCLKILCDYYTIDEGLPGDTSLKIIKNPDRGIFWGTCDSDPRNWALGYEPPSDLQANWWWINAGYASASCFNVVRGNVTNTTTTTVESGITLKCDPEGNKIKCNWSGCSNQEKPLSVSLKKIDRASIECILELKNTKPSGNCEVTVPEAGDYEGRLACNDSIKKVNVVVS